MGIGWIGWLDSVLRIFAEHGPFVGTLAGLYALTVWAIWWFSNRLFAQMDKEIQYLRKKLEKWEQAALSEKKGSKKL